MPGSTDLLRMAPDVSGSEFERKLIYYTPLFTVIQEYSEFTVQHRLKYTAADRPVLLVPLILYSDETSGNKSKRWNKFDSWCLKLASLPNQFNQNLQNIHHLCSSNKVDQPLYLPFSPSLFLSLSLSLSLSLCTVTPLDLDICSISLSACVTCTHTYIIFLSNIRLTVLKW